MKQELCKYGCGNVGKYKFKTIKGMCCSEYSCQCPVIQKKIQKNNIGPILSESSYKTNKKSPIFLKMEYKDILNKWNFYKIIVHRRPTQTIKKAIIQALVDYSHSEIFAAIENYSQILKSDIYFWTYKYTLKDFLVKGLDKFLDEADPLNNYIDGNGKTKNTEEQIPRQRRPLPSEKEKDFSRSKEIAQDLLKKLGLENYCLEDHEDKYYIDIHLNTIMDIRLIEDAGEICIDKKTCSCEIRFHYNTDPFISAKIIQAIDCVYNFEIQTSYKKNKIGEMLLWDEEEKKWIS